MAADSSISAPAARRLAVRAPRLAHRAAHAPRRPAARPRARAPRRGRAAPGARRRPARAGAGRPRDPLGPRHDVRPRPRRGRPARAARSSARARSGSWTVLGASRGEPGILGEGIRHALLPDPTFAPALAAARRMLGMSRGRVAWRVDPYTGSIRHSRAPGAARRDARARVRRRRGGRRLRRGLLGVADRRRARSRSRAPRRAGRRLDVPARVRAARADVEGSWKHVHLWLGDERCVPDGDPESNAQMVRESLYANARAEPASLHAVPSPLVPEDAAWLYGLRGRAVRARRRVRHRPARDGARRPHVLAVPRTSGALRVSQAPVAPVRESPKPPPERDHADVARRGTGARFTQLLVTGADKRDALARTLAGEAGLPLAMLGDGPRRDRLRRGGARRRGLSVRWSRCATAEYVGAPTIEPCCMSTSKAPRRAFCDQSSTTSRSRKSTSIGVSAIVRNALARARTCAGSIGAAGMTRA